MGLGSQLAPLTRGVDPRALQQIAVFRFLSDADLRALTDGAQQHVYARGALLATPGDSAEALFAVARGGVRVYRVAPLGRTITLEVCQAGATFELTHRDAAAPSPGYAEALEDDTLVYVLDGPRALAILATCPQASRLLIDELRHRVATAQAAMEDLALYPTPTRLARTLLDLVAGGVGSRVEQSHEHLAGRIGVSREKVTKELRHLHALGLIAYRPHRPGILVRDPAGLAALADAAPASTHRRS